jgi:adenylate cyclase class 2
MLEIEQKFADADFPPLERLLAEWGASKFEQHEEEDQYLAAPDRDFRVTGEAFRMRRSAKSAFLTYKGPKLQTEAKIRTELELPLPDGENMPEQYLQLFRHLGYRPVAVVRKRRRQYPLMRQGFSMTVCLDEVEGLGHYAEVEILAEKEQLEKAQAVLLETAAALGLKKVERRSYLALVLGQPEPEGRQGDKETRRQGE